MCRPKWQAGSLGSAYFIGYVFTLLWLPRLADVYGRKKIFAYGMAVQSIFYTVLMFTNNFYVMLVTTFCFGLLASIRQVIGFVFFLELMPKNTQTTVACIFTIIDGLTYLVVSMYFWVISKHWFYIIFVAYIFQIVGAVLSWFLPESPVYLIS